MQASLCTYVNDALHFLVWDSLFFIVCALKSGHASSCKLSGTRTLIVDHLGVAIGRARLVMEWMFLDTDSSQNMRLVQCYKQ